MISFADGAPVPTPATPVAPRFALGERVRAHVEGQTLEGWVRASLWVGGPQPVLCWVSFPDADGAFPEELLEPVVSPS